MKNAMTDPLPTKEAWVTRFEWKTGLSVIPVGDECAVGSGRNEYFLISPTGIRIGRITLTNSEGGWKLGGTSTMFNGLWESL